MNIEAHTSPYRHWIVDDFELPGLLAAHWDLAAGTFPAVDWPHWLRYDSPFESKRTCEDLDRMPVILEWVVRNLQHQATVDWFSELTGINGLMTDPTLRGGGLHASAAGDRLDIHLDYAIHPQLNLERRLNAILFLNTEWKAEWKGALELWDREGRRKVAEVLPRFRRLVLFECSDESYHGCPAPLACPPSVLRSTVAVYYLTPPRGRRRALFVPRRESRG